MTEISRSAEQDTAETDASIAKLRSEFRMIADSALEKKENKSNEVEGSDHNDNIGKNIDGNNSGPNADDCEEGDVSIENPSEIIKDAAKEDQSSSKADGDEDDRSSSDSFDIGKVRSEFRSIANVAMEKKAKMEKEEDIKDHLVIVASEQGNQDHLVEENNPGILVAVGDEGKDHDNDTIKEVDDDDGGGSASGGEGINPKATAVPLRRR